LPAAGVYRLYNIYLDAKFAELADEAHGCGISIEQLLGLTPE
jgi:hypothetical protein